MEKVRIAYEGFDKQVPYTKKYAHGIFLVGDTKVANSNCKILNIDLGTTENELELLQRVTKLGETGIVSIKLMDTEMQYIIKSYADPIDVERLVSSAPPQSKEALKAAYSLAKTNTAAELGTKDNNFRSN